MNNRKTYQFYDWLSNVRVVVNDKKTPVNSGTTTVSYMPQVVSVSDYYSFGSEIGERTYSKVKYRFGFNDKENIDEIYGSGNFQDYGARMYDTRLGRFISPDPLIITQHKYTYYSPYQFAGNKPVVAIDLDGKEDLWINTQTFANGSKVTTEVWKNENNENTLRKNISENLGIPEWVIPDKGVFVSSVTYDENNKISNVLFYQSNPVTVEGLNTSGGVSGTIGHFLKGVIPEKNYTGKEGMKTAGKDMLHGASKAGDVGLALTAVGYGALLLGQPEIGIPLIAVGEALSTVGDVGDVGSAFVDDGIIGGGKEISKKGVLRIFEKKYEKVIQNSKLTPTEKNIREAELNIGTQMIDKNIESNEKDN